MGGEWGERGEGLVKMGVFSLGGEGKEGKEDEDEEEEGGSWGGLEVGREEKKKT